MLCPSCNNQFTPIECWGNKECVTCILKKKRRMILPTNRLCGFCKKNPVNKGRNKYCSEECLLEATRYKVNNSWHKKIKSDDGLFKT